MRRSISFLLSLTAVTVFAAFFAACGPTASGPGGSGDGNETAATVNGKTIKREEVERAIKQQAQGQEIRLSPLELAAGRLQVLQTLIEQEVMFQKAEKEGTVPTDDEVSGEFNKTKTASGMSAEDFDKKMTEIGETETSARLAIKKRLAIVKLNEKITGKIEAPKDNEIATFYNNNPEAFKAKRGAQLAAIVIDPRAAGQNGAARSDLELQTKLKDIIDRLQSGADFATVARETSEDQNTAYSGGDWRYFTEEEMKQAFPQGFAEAVMSRMQNGQIIPQPLPFEGKYIVVKLQRKQETDEARTLETPGVRQEIIDFLLNSRKQLLAASYQTIAMNEAKIENFLAKQVVANPNELSGARPAAPANSNTNSAPAVNTANANASNSTNAAPAANTANVAANAPKPAANSNTNANR